MKRVRQPSDDRQLGLFELPFTLSGGEAGVERVSVDAELPLHIVKDEVGPVGVEGFVPDSISDASDAHKTTDIAFDEALTVRQAHRERVSGGELQLPDALRLDRNLALMAGAGTGKTHNLITLCLHALGGAREGVTVAPHALGLLTFTDKAAGEMRQRLYARLDALAHGSTEKEPELVATFAAMEKPFPEPAYWRGVRDALGGAPIGTFHSLCVQLLREAPAGRAFSPSFELLDERSAQDLLSDLADRVVLAAIEEGDTHVADLAREWGLSGGRMGLSRELTAAFGRMREEGQTPDSLAVGDELSARAAFNTQYEKCMAALAIAEADALKKRKRENEERAAEYRRLLTGFTIENAADRLPPLLEILKRRDPPLREAVGGKDKGEVLGLRHYVAGVRAIPYEHAVKRLLGELAKAHEQALRRQNALDFTALLIESRDLLRDDLEFRRTAQRRFEVLLVDELQDTNRVQLELIHLLGEERHGGPRRTNPPLIGAEHSVTELPLEPGFLCVVGDRKQSIYEFRGADVSVVEQAALAIEASNGGRAFLKQSRRSSPKIVGFLNRVMPRLMSDPRTQILAAMEPGEGDEVPTAAPARSFEVSYVPAQDDLTAFRSQDLAEDVIERFVDPPPDALADDLRLLDSSVLARRVRELIESGTRGKDIALLFRRFSFVEAYRQALLAEGVPHRLVRGRGFYGAQEVMDLSALLSLVSDPGDALSLAVVLRSPLVGLRDSSLVLLARATGERLAARDALALEQPPVGFSPFEATRFHALQALVSRLRDERHRTPVRKLLEIALNETGYLEAMAGTAFGPQVLANIEKLLELASRADDCGAFARELTTLSDADPLEAQAETLDESDADAVTLCTIHQAKGLEWPVVVLPELFAPSATRGARIRFERDRGLAVRLPDPMADTPGSPRFEHARLERNAREKADLKRLQYVALTRARDRLILGVTKKGAAWAELDEACAGVEGIRSCPLVAPEARPPLQRDTASKNALALVQAAARLKSRPEPIVRSVMLPVTQLQEHALCPRRYRFAYVLGLPERGLEVRAEVEVGDGEPAGLDIRERGTAAHKLLEKVVLGVPTAPQLVDIARAEGLPDDPEVRGWVQRFLDTPFARAMTNVHRELPFVLRLGGPDFKLHLRGQIDLLVMNDEGATVVDYKTSVRPKEGLDAYRFQLGCYALAARALLGDVPIRAGIAFLREPDASPQLLPPGAPVDESWLVAQARALVTAQIRGEWQGLPLEHCQALGCGYVNRCHPATARL